MIKCNLCGKELHLLLKCSCGKQILFNTKGISKKPHKSKRIPFSKDEDVKNG